MFSITPVNCSKLHHRNFFIQVLKFSYVSKKHSVTPKDNFFSFSDHHHSNQKRSSCSLFQRITISLLKYSIKWALGIHPHLRYISFSFAYSIIYFLNLFYHKFLRIQFHANSRALSVTCHICKHEMCFGRKKM